MISNSCDFNEFLKSVLGDDIQTIKRKVNTERVEAQSKEGNPSTSPGLRSKLNPYWHRLLDLETLLQGNISVPKSKFVGYQHYIDRILAKM